MVDSGGGEKGEGAGREGSEESVRYGGKERRPVDTRRGGKSAATLEGERGRGWWREMGGGKRGRSGRGYGGGRGTGGDDAIRGESGGKGEMGVGGDTFLRFSDLNWEGVELRGVSRPGSNRVPEECRTLLEESSHEGPGGKCGFLGPIWAMERKLK